jgi:amino acid adenylation domain-containing protein
MADLTEEIARLDPRKRILLEVLMAEEARNAALQLSIPRRPDRAAPVPLSPAQERLWFLDQLVPGNPAYNMPASFRLTGEVLPAALRATLNVIARRHEALRTTFVTVHGQPLQVVAPDSEMELPVIDLSGLEVSVRQVVSAGLAAAESLVPFALATGPLCRASLLRLHATEHILLVTVHHIVSDGWSMGVLFRELESLYGAVLGEGAAALPDLPVQYQDYAEWQRQRLRGAWYEERVAVWRQRLAGAPPILDLPTDRRRPAAQSYRGQTESLTFLPSLAEELRQAARRQGATLFMSLLAAFAVLLGRWSDSEDIVIGTPVAGRDRKELEPLIGLFLSMLPLRIYLSENPGFDELLKRVRSTVLDAYDDSEIPFERLLDDLGLERSLGHSPLFQVLFVLQNAVVSPPHLPGLAVEPFEVGRATAKLDLQLVLAEHDSVGIRGWIEYSADLFERDTIQRMGAHLQTLLSGIATSSNRPIWQLPLLSPGEEHQALAGWNDTARPYVLDRCLHEWIEAQVVASPERAAVGFAGETLSYGTLDVRANRLARHLQRLGVGLEDRVAVCAERSPELVVALVGILKAGAAYVPLDPEYPTERLQIMLEDSAARVLLTQERLRGKLAAGLPIVALDAGWSAIERESANPPPGVVNPEQEAYLIFTSGSTGRPKGAVVSHRGICNRLLWMQEAYRLGPEDRVLQKTPFSFDVSVWEFFWPLMAGARLVMARPGGHRDGAYLVETIAREGITTIHFVPSMLQAFLEEAEVSRCRSLRRVICSGEALPKALQDRFFERLETEFQNLYGPTEASVDVTFWACEKESRREAVPIGRPIANVQIHLLDRYMGQVPAGVPGDLHIGGVGVGRGYAGQPDLTAERFVPDPFSSGGGRLYRTGDLCRRLPDGAIEYLGRLDHQVKVRGFRIELGEIEANLVQLPGIREATVAARRDTPGETVLVAYLVAEADRHPPVGDLRNALLEALPEHMVPAKFVFLDALPLSPNGKIDRKALPAPDLRRPDLAETFVPPRTHAEEVLSAVWSRVLGYGPIGICDNFFALGGDSMRSIRVLALARERGLELSLQQLFQHQTIAALAALAGSSGQREAPRTEPMALLSEEDRRILPDGVQDAYPLAQLQAGMLFHSEMEPGSAVYHDVFSLCLRARFSAALLREALRRLAARHPVLRTSFDLAGFGEPLQLVHTAVEIPLAVEDLSGRSDQEQRVAAWIEEEKRRAFDPGRAPLLRYAVHIRGEGEFQLTLSFHHAILDGWSIASLTTELLRLYSGLLRGGDLAPAPPLAVAFRDFVALELEAIRSAEAETFWLERLKGSGRIVLPRWPRPEREQEGRRVLTRGVRIPPEVASGLANLARQTAVPIKSVLLAAHVRTLGLLSGQAEILTGLVANGRPEEAEGDTILGLFLNVTPFRYSLAGGTWIDLVQAAFDAEREALPFRRYPMARLQRSLGGEPLFETCFNFVHFHIYENVRTLPGIEVVDARFDEQTSFSLVANFSLGSTSERSMVLDLSYDPGRFGEDQIHCIAEYYSRCLEALATAPESRYEYTALQPAEEAAALAGWNATNRLYNLKAPLHAWIEEQAARTPDVQAVSCHGQALSYRELAERAGRLAQHLRRSGVGRGSQVAVCVERSLEMIVGLLGALSAGAAYVPLDPSYPEERLAWMLGDARAAALLTQERLAHLLPVAGVPLVRLDADWPGIAAGRGEGEVPIAGSDDLAYIIYTSGSTGRPKGAMVPHRGIVNRLLWMQEAYGLTPEDRVLQKTPFSFDVSVWEFFWPLMVGARLVIARPEGHRDPSYLVDTIEREGVTTVHFVPSMLRVFLDDPEVARCRGLRRVICSGEALLPTLVERFFARLPGVELHNLYGPTEASVDVTAWPCEAGERVVPIGRPISNIRMHVLDRHLGPSPLGSPGELHIAGVGLGRGYLGRPELTAERFIPDLFGEPGSRMYRTGDLARWLPGGALGYLGRIDYQVKIRGFRIELGEVEAVLGLHPAVVECAVAALQQNEEHQLVAYVVIRESEVGVEDLRSFLQARLPEHMVPSLFVQLDALPLSPNGKVDRKALPAPGPERPNLGLPYVHPETDVERELAWIWERVLGIARVGAEDDFIALGGDSILSIRVSAMARGLGFQVSLPELFEHRTIRRLARNIHKREEDPESLLQRLDQLGEAEVSRLLEQMLTRE